MTNTPDTTTARPLAVWPCAQHAPDRACGNRSAPFEIARRAIETYSEPGDLVVDPLCTDPNLPVVLEAIRQQRNVAAAIGHNLDDLPELDQRVRAANAAGEAGEAVLLRGDPSELPRLLAAQAGRLLRRHRHLHPGVRVHPGGSADLILLFVPAVLSLGRRQERTRRRQTRFDALEVLAAAASVLRPGGYLVSTANGDELHASGRDPGSETVSRCEELGLRYWQHIVALLVPIDSGQLKPPRRRRDVAESTLPRIVHQNVHVFRKPTVAETRTESRNIDARRAA